MVVGENQSGGHIVEGGSYHHLYIYYSCRRPTLAHAACSHYPVGPVEYHNPEFLMVEILKIAADIAECVVGTPHRHLVAQILIAASHAQLEGCCKRYGFCRADALVGA